MSNLVELTVASPSKSMANIEDLELFARTFEVVDEATADMAAAALNDLAAFAKAAKKEHAEMKDPILKAGRKVDAYWKPIIKQAEDAADMLRDRIKARLLKQQREYDRAQQEARAQARLEQERLTLEAAAREQAGRADAKRLRDRAQELEAAGNKTAAAELRSSAVRAEMGAQQDAQELTEQAAHASALPVVEPYKPAGISARKRWTWEPVSVEETVKALCPVCHPERRYPMSVLTHDGSVIGAMVRAQRDEFSIPGIATRPETDIAATGRHDDG